MVAGMPVNAVQRLKPESVRKGEGRGSKRLAIVNSQPSGRGHAISMPRSFLSPILTYSIISHEIIKIKTRYQEKCNKIMF